MPDSAPNSPDRGASRLLMIVEDDRAVREALCHIATANGFVPLSHSSVSGAVRSLAITRPVAVLLDWDLGSEQTGVDVARAAARCAWQPAIFMITGSSIDKLRAEMQNLPVVAYLQKPFRKASVDQLLQEL